MKRRALLFVLPALGLLLWTIAPLVSGERTLILRDVLTTHMELRAELGRAIRLGELPLVDGARSGGQGLFGNPNAVPLYPDNLLLLVASDLWQLNAHFWLHWLLALPAMYGLARVWGLGREGSWAAAVLFAFSGYFVSQMNLYNDVAVVALAPALAAALLATADAGRRRWALPALGGLWALELLAGDPILAVIALLAALALAASEWRRLPWGWVALAVVAGTAIAAPQWIEMLRLLPGSYRGAWGTGAVSEGRSSPTVLALVELVLPLHFGRPDLGEAWGGRHYFGGVPPLYFSLAPGLLALAALAAGARGGGRRNLIAVAALAGSGVIVSVPALAGALAAWLPGSGLFRFNVKFALVGVLAASLVAARGIERVGDDPAMRRRWRIALGALLGLELVVAIVLAMPDSQADMAFRALFARGLDDAALPELRSRWIGSALTQAAAVSVALVALWKLERRQILAAALLAVHAAFQVPLLRALCPTDESAAYQETPALLRALPNEAVIAHGSTADLFGAGYFENGTYPDASAHWRSRRAYADLYSFALAAAGRRTEFRPSSEGLDAFPVQATASAIRRLPDAQRLRVLAATGVDHLLLPRQLDVPREAAETIAAHGEGDPAMQLFRLPGAIPDALVVGEWSYAPHMNAALAGVLDPVFDPLQRAILAGSGPAREGLRGRARIVRWSADAIELEVDSASEGVVVVRRAWSALWSAEVDGLPAPVRIANLTRLAVEVPPGPHRVRFSVSKRPFAAGVLVSALGLATLVGMARWRRGSTPDERAAGSAEVA